MLASGLRTTAAVIEKAFGSNDDAIVGTMAMIPAPVVRLSARHLIMVRRNAELAKYTPSTDVDFAAYLKKEYPDVAVATDEANEQHYTCPTPYFDLVLGKYKKYSCCVFDGENDTLEAAEVRTLRKYCEWLGLDDLRAGSSVLDLGCGWGSFTLFAAEQYPDLKFTCISNSPTQREYILGKGHPNVKCLTVNLGQEKNLADLKGTYDRAISIEMFEHMKRYDILLKHVARLLKPTGKLLVHIFVHDRAPYEFKKGWMARNFFTGGNMPSKNLLYQFQDHLHITRTESINGTHYQRTLDTWLALHETHKDEIIDIFEKNEPGSGHKSWTAWWMFYALCSECFGLDAGAGAGNEYFVQLYLFDKSHAE
eukprot:m.453795 g.453795  ORF g.453795 m.453795 type:complete len:366 (+) comp20552_c0_seq1:47-1144(+)